MKKIKGFTLIELIIVMIIIGIVSIVVVPTFIGDEDININVGAGIVRDDLRYAVDYAINTGIPVRIEFDISGATGYTFKEKLSDGSWSILTKPAETTPYEVTLGSGNYKDLYISDVNINGTDWLYINSMGVPLDKNIVPLTNGMDSYITLNDMKSIDIYPITGMIKLRE